MVQPKRRMQLTYQTKEHKKYGRTDLCVHIFLPKTYVFAKFTNCQEFLIQKKGTHYLCAPLYHFLMSFYKYRQ